MTTENTYLGIARCTNRKCGFGFGLPDKESLQKCLDKSIKCPLCGNKLEVEE